MKIVIQKSDALDLCEGAALSLHKKNILFAFDDIELERTEEFAIPATPKNDRVFGLCKDFHNDGIGARARYNAQVQDGSMVLDGWLYVSKCSRLEYSCVFVFGDLLGLKAIKDAGKIAELINVSNAFRWQEGETVYPASVGATLPWAPVRYESDTEKPLKPSANLRYLFQQAVVAGLPIQVPNNSQYVRILPGELMAASERVVQFLRDTTPPEPGITGTNVWSADDVLFSIGDLTYALYGSINYTVLGQTVQHLKAKTAVKITFPANFPSDVFVGYFVFKGFNIYDNMYVDQSFVFYGDYSFDRAKVISGNPLAGRSIIVPNDGQLAFVRLSEYYSRAAGAAYDGWRMETNLDLSGVTVSGADSEAEPGDLVYLQDNLPDMTFVELAKMWAAMKGLALNYTPSDGLTFDPLNADEWQVVEIREPLSWSALERRFGNFAQQNMVLFDSDETVPELQRKGFSYNLENVNLEQVSELYKIPFSEGGVTEAGNVFVSDETKNNTIMGGARGIIRRETLGRVEMAKNSTIAKLCDIATSIELRAHMSVFEYSRITPHTRIHFDGALWVWTEAQHADGVATLHLSKIA